MMVVMNSVNTQYFVVKVILYHCAIYYRRFTLVEILSIIGQHVFYSNIYFFKMCVYIYIAYICSV